MSWQEGRKNVKEDDKGIYTSKALEQKQADEWFNKIEPTNIDPNKIADNFDKRSNEMISEAKTKMLGYYNNSLGYYWFQILGASLLMSVPLVLLIFAVIEYFSLGLIKNDNQLVALYLTCSALITINFHRHYQK